MKSLHKGSVVPGNNICCSNSLFINLLTFIDGRGVAGAVFSLTSEDGVIYDTTDLCGLAIFGDLLEGEYVLSITSLPPEYLSDDIKIKIKVRQTGIYINRTRQNCLTIPARYKAAVTIGVMQNSNPKPNECVSLLRKPRNSKGRIRGSITQQILPLNPLVRLEETLFSQGNSREIIRELKTDNDGKVLFSNLPPGEYIAEVKSAGCCAPITVKHNGDILICRKAKKEHTFTIWGKGCLQVKVNSCYEGTLKDIQLALCGEGNRTIRKNTDICGIACFSDLEPGCYTGEVLSAGKLTSDGTVFRVFVDCDGMVYINSKVGNTLEINLTPKKQSPQISYFFVRDENGIPLSNVPFTLSTPLNSETFYSDQNGKVILCSLCPGDEYKISPHDVKGYITPEPFTIELSECRWLTDSIPLELSVAIYKAERPIVRKSFIWCDCHNKNNTRQEVTVKFYINEQLTASETIGIDDDFQNLNFFLDNTSDNYRIEIINLPDGYTAVKRDTGFIFRIKMVKTENIAVLAANNILIDKVSCATPYNSDVTLCPQKFAVPLSVTPHKKILENVTEDGEFTFFFSFL